MDLDRIVALDPEQALLVATLRGEPLPTPNDEVRLAAVAAWHRLDGVLARHLPGTDVVTDAMVEHVRASAVATVGRHQRLRARLVDLVDLWAEAGIRATLLKGSALVEAGIVAAAERPMADLDVLVEPAAVEEAHRLARTHAGFGTSTDGSDWAHARQRHHHLPALDDGAGTVVELHHRLLDRDHPLAGLDGRLRHRRVALPGLAADRLDDVALWLHGAVHCWDDRRRGTGGALLQLRDLDLLGPRMDLDEVVEVVDAADADHLVGTLAAVLDEVLPDPVAHHLRRRLHGPVVQDRNLDAFVRRRVLGRRGALAQLVHPTGDVTYSTWRLLTRARRQAWPPRTELVRVLGPDGRRRDHLAGLRRVVGDAVSHPRATVVDLRLDRWASRRT